MDLDIALPAFNWHDGVAILWHFTTLSEGQMIARDK